MIFGLTLEVESSTVLGVAVGILRLYVKMLLQEVLVTSARVCYLGPKLVGQFTFFV